MLFGLQGLRRAAPGDALAFLFHAVRAGIDNGSIVNAGVHENLSPELVDR